MPKKKKSKCPMLYQLFNYYPDMDIFEFYEEATSKKVAIAIAKDWQDGAYETDEMRIYKIDPKPILVVKGKG